MGDDDNDDDDMDNILTTDDEIPSNERLLGIAFVTFMTFALTQLVFAFVAGSQAMMGDSAAMIVDSVTYLFNYVAERKKHQFDTATTSQPMDQNALSDDPIKAERIRKRNRRKMVLQLEIIPPTISVTTLIIVTIFVTKKAIRILRLDMHRSRSEQHLPNINLMLAFSLLNLVLDGLNVFCFARAKHLMGYATSITIPMDQNCTTSMDHTIADEDTLSKNQTDNYDTNHTNPITTTGSVKTCTTGVPSAGSQQKVGPGYSQVPSRHHDNGSIPVATSTGTVRNSHNTMSSVGGDHDLTMDDLERSGTVRKEIHFHHPNMEHHHDQHRTSEQRRSPGIHDHDTNLNMCSAYTHVFADTLRSIAVIVAAALAEIVPNITPEVADATAAVVVSFLILLSLIPLIQGLISSITELLSILEEERSDMAFLRPPSTIGHFEMT
jgi:Co/Zn/Cd efflux system component